MKQRERAWRAGPVGEAAWGVVAMGMVERLPFDLIVRGVREIFGKRKLLLWDDLGAEGLDETWDELLG